MIEELLHTAVEKALQSLYGAEGQSIQFQKTRKDFDGDITLVVFSLLGASLSVCKGRRHHLSLPLPEP